jgi:tripartite-type tricarboxylate transporter receptor subunit TctC
MFGHQNIKTAVAAGAFATLSALSSAALAQDYPTKPVTMVVPYAAGGSASDIMGRAVAQKLSEIWGKSVIVDNKPGATTTIGIDHVAHQSPDGYTLLLAPPPFIITQYVYPDLKYTMKSFDAVSLVAYYPYVLTVNVASPVKTIADLVALAKKQPGLTYGTPGAGSTPHLLSEMFAKGENLDVTHVPYRGGGPVVVDLVANRLGFYIGIPTEVMPNIKIGKLRPIAILSPKRSDLLPDVPTSTEAGYAYLQGQSWSTVIVPKGTPKPIIDKISKDIAKGFSEGELRDKLASQGAIFVGSTPEELAAHFEAEDKRFGPLVKSIGLKPE